MRPRTAKPGAAARKHLNDSANPLEEIAQEQMETIGGLNATHEELQPANMDHIIQQEHTDISMTPKRETLSPCDNPGQGILSSDDDGQNYLTKKRDS